jgi:prolyl 4-hydroxylase
MDRKLIFMAVGVIVIILVAWYFMPAKQESIDVTNPEISAKPITESYEIPGSMNELTASSTYKKPILGLVKNFINYDECQDLINLGKLIVEPSLVGFGNNSEINENYRRSSHSWIKHNASPTLHRLTQYISSILKIPPNHFEPYQIVNYQPGGYYKYHLDSCNPSASDYSECIKNLNQHGGRKYTVLIYLNNDYEGGETHFKLLDTSIKGNPGDMVFFQNMKENSKESDLLSEHAGTSVKSGEKWLLNLWIRDMPYNIDYSNTSFPCDKMISNIEAKIKKDRDEIERKQQYEQDIANGNELPSREPPSLNETSNLNDESPTVNDSNPIQQS